MKSKTDQSQPAAAPRLSIRKAELQKFGVIVPLPLGLSQEACSQSVHLLNQILADSITLRDLYKKHHWQVSGPTFFQLHQLYDKHYAEQSELVDLLAERIQLLGGVSVAMAADVAELTHIERPPMGREAVSTQLSRLLDGHESLLRASHEAAEAAQDNGDDGTNDLLVSNVIRTNEFQVWFLAQHLVPNEGIEEKSDVDTSAGRAVKSNGGKNS